MRERQTAHPGFRSHRCRQAQILMAEGGCVDDAVVKEPEPGWIGQVLGTTVTSLEAWLH